MERRMLKSKLHRAVVTHADVAYEGSLTLDRDFMAAADIVPFEEVQVWNVTRGTRFATYAIEGERGSRVVCCNGAAAHLAKPGDQVIIATFVNMTDAEARAHEPKLVFLDGRENRILPRTHEVAGPRLVSNG